MSLFTAGDKLKIVVLGNDGVMRAAFVERNATMAGNKYIITQKDVFFQRIKKWDLFWIDQPTIMFRENSIHAIPRSEEDSYPTPQETTDIIENAAMHLFTLFGKQSNLMMILLLILAGIGAGSGCAGAYFSYTAGKQITDNHADINAMSAQVANLTYTQTGGGIPTGGIIPPATVPRGTVAVPTPTLSGLPKV
jgi:hypothetical protein